MAISDGIYNLLNYFRSLEPDNTFYKPMKYILTHVGSIASMSIYELADQCFVSTASISRLCRALGYKNYQELKLALSVSYLYASQHNDQISPYLSPRDDNDDPVQSRVLNFLNHCRANILWLEDLIRSGQFDRHLALIRDSERIFFFSPIHRDVTALQRRAVLSGKLLMAYSGSSADMLRRSKFDLDPENGRNCCCVFFPNTPESYETFRASARELRQTGARLIMFSPESLQAGKDAPLYDVMTQYPDEGALSDEAYVANFIACISISL